jgi:hypothetical protein
VFLAITMVQLIMTTVWSCDRKWKVAVVITAVLGCWRTIPTTVHRPLKIVAERIDLLLGNDRKQTWWQQFNTQQWRNFWKWCFQWSVPWS